MKVLQIGATFVGAQKKIEYAIHEHLLAKGHDSKILYAIGESDDPNVIRYENRAAELLRRALRKVLGRHHRFAFLSTRGLIRRIKEMRPDLIHIHVIHHGYLDFERLLKYIGKQGIPVVFTAHDMWFFTGGCYYYSTARCEGFRAGCVGCAKEGADLDCPRRATARNLQRKLYLYEGLKRAAFVSVSPWVREEMEKSALARYPLYTVMNAVDGAREATPVGKKRERFTIIGVAASWDERKGIHRFFELGRALEDTCDIILVGSAMPSLKREAPENVTFYGYTKSAEELYALYATADLHVSMSLEETFGLTFVEAALCGVRSLGFDSTAIPAVLQRTNGYVISSLSVADAAKRIRELARDREACAIAQKERAEIRRYFSTERMALEYQRVYEEVVSSSAPLQGEIH